MNGDPRKLHDVEQAIASARAFAAYIAEFYNELRTHMTPEEAMQITVAYFKMSPPAPPTEPKA